MWKLRRAVKLGRLVPFVVGSALGVPLGAALLKSFGRLNEAGFRKVVLGLLLLSGLALIIRTG